MRKFVKFKFKKLLFETVPLTPGCLKREEQQTNVIVIYLSYLTVYQDTNYKHVSA